ncbi:MAG: outer membrane beta-barrel protein [Flavisolibacter sp.]|nr:outer membrane beta-barrel protein [Flavisolibacter sp.]MBD0295703.1 outer membrane beta-barrel protein [Flavisolibacter sp.]MBD0365264.1 outer membrane beta-barrel protein [Flavisolibacter sp.]
MKTCLTVLFLLQFLCIYSQFQIGLFGGISDYNGDLLDKPYRFSRPAGGPTVGYQLSERFSMRVGATLGKIEGADSVSVLRGFSHRNLSFQSRLSEVALTAECNFFRLENLRWTPFAFIGLAVYHYNPYTYDQHHQRYYLRPLSTEGQGLPQYPDRKPYALTKLAFPVGGGIKYALADQFQIAAQIGLRITSNDYLDDVSTTYVDEQTLLNARGPKAAELSYRVRELPGGDQTYPREGKDRGRYGKLIFTDFYYFSGLHFIYSFGSFGEGEGSAFTSNAWKRKRLKCVKL